MNLPEKDPAEEVELALQALRPIYEAHLMRLAVVRICLAQGDHKGASLALRPPKAVDNTTRNAAEQRLKQALETLAQSKEEGPHGK